MQPQPQPQPQPQHQGEGGGPTSSYVYVYPHTDSMAEILYPMAEFRYPIASAPPCTPPPATYPHALDPPLPFYSYYAPAPLAGPTSPLYPHLQPSSSYNPYESYNPDTSTISSQGLYAYDGLEKDVYGARGSSGLCSGFDDYGRVLGSAMSSDSTNAQCGAVDVENSGECAEAEIKEGVDNGVRKFRAKLLPEGSGQEAVDVICQIGLDGIRLFDSSMNRTLRIYPLDTVIGCEIMDSTIFLFWAKSSVDFEPRRIRLELKRHMTNIILDTATAAIFQFKEIDGQDALSRNKNSDSEQAEKKKGLVEWMNLIRPINEEKDHWVPDEVVSKCTSCRTDFGAFVRKHHCRNCGDIFCDRCTSGRIALSAAEQAQPVRVCDKCMAEVTQRLCNSKSDTKPAVTYRHEDLAKKLQVEMDKKRRELKVQKSLRESIRELREVACPTCTVHLKVYVPHSEFETIECNVCRQPFLISAH